MPVHSKIMITHTCRLAKLGVPARFDVRRCVNFYTHPWGLSFKGVKSLLASNDVKFDVGIIATSAMPLAALHGTMVIVPNGDIHNFAPILWI